MIGQFKDDLKNLHEQIMASKFAAQANRLVEAAGATSVIQNKKFLIVGCAFLLNLTNK